MAVSRSSLSRSLFRSLRVPPASGFPLAAMAASVAVGVVVWLASGVRPLEILGFGAYEAVFALAPGVLLLRALVRRRASSITQLAVGWPLGHAFELAAFWVTAAIGARWLFFLYPPAVCGIAAWIAFRRPSGAPTPGIAVPRAPAWATAAVVGLAVALIGLGSFATNPLPRSVPSVVLYDDNVFDVAVAAEARHHWPITDPNVSGEPLRYHVFVFMKAAALEQTTGIPLDVTILRLEPLLFVLLISLQLAWLAGRAARGTPWAAPGAVAIMLLANELDLDIARDAPFLGLFSVRLPLSPTFAFGLPFFIAATGVLLRALSRPEQPERGTWLVLAVLFAAAMGAKASTLPVLLAALGVFFVARAAVDRTVHRRALGALGLAFGVFVVVYVAMFSGGGSDGAAIHPGAFLAATVVAGGFSGPISSAIGGVACTAALLAPWLGALLLISRVRGTERTAALWLGAIVVAALVPLVLLRQLSLAQVYFFNYGTPAAAVLSAWGIARAWPHARRSARPLVALAAALVTAVVLAGVLDARAPRDATVTLPGYLGAYAALVVVLVIVSILTARRARSALAGTITLVVAVTLLDVPLDVVPSWVRTERAGNPHYRLDRRAGPRGIDPQLLAGLHWLRGHSSPRDVLAVNVQKVSATRESARYFDYAAFAERRTFLGGWDYTTAAIKHVAEDRPGVPFAGRRALNAAAFRGDRHALEILRRRYGVRFLLADLRHQPPSPGLDGQLPRIYANPALRIYRLTG